MLSMLKRKNPLAFVATVILVGSVVFATTSAVFAQTSDAKNKSYDSSGSIRGPQDNSATQWVSTEGSATIDGETQYTTSFMTENCTFSSIGRNPFFILEPNYQLVLAGEEDGEEVVLTITVFNETRGVNGTETRIVEERETVASELVEVSRNFFAICEETNSVFYFGEEVDDYENGRIVAHEGAWLAGENNNTAGIIMPGTILLGARYYQELAPDVALDRAEIIEMDGQVETPAGSFTNVLVVREMTPLEPDIEEFKYHVAGIGLIQDADLRLEQYGFIG
jgi:hypothetical protein